MYVNLQFSKELISRFDISIDEKIFHLFSHISDCFFRFEFDTNFPRTCTLQTERSEAVIFDGRAMIVL